MRFPPTPQTSYPTLVGLIGMELFLGGPQSKHSLGFVDLLPPPILVLVQETDLQNLHLVRQTGYDASRPTDWVEVARGGSPPGEKSTYWFWLSRLRLNLT